MRRTKDNQGIWLFLGFLLLAGVAYLFTRTQIAIVDTFMFSANFIINIVLLMSWMYSVRARLLPTKARGYIVAAAILMMAELHVRFLRFRILTEIVIRRYKDDA